MRRRRGGPPRLSREEIWLLTVYARAPVPRAYNRIAAEYGMSAGRLALMTRRLSQLGLLIYHLERGVHEITDAGRAMVIGRMHG